MNILTKLLASTFLTSAFMAPLAFGTEPRFVMIGTDMPQVARTRIFKSVEKMLNSGSNLIDMASKGNYKGVLAAAARPDYPKCPFVFTISDLEQFFFSYTFAQASSHLGLADIVGISLNEKKNHHIAASNLVSRYMLEWGSKTSIQTGINDRIKEHSFCLSLSVNRSLSALVDGLSFRHK